MIETIIKAVTGNNHGFECSPTMHILYNERKMMDVIFDTQCKQTPDFLDPKVYKKVAKDFGLHKMYGSYNKIVNFGIDFYTELSMDEPNPESLKKGHG